MSMAFSPVFAAFIEKLATRDDEIRSQYEAHCAAEERKREDAEDIMAVEGLGAAEAARWAEEQERKREASDEVPESGIKFVIKDGDRSQAFIDLVDKYYYAPLRATCGALGAEDAKAVKGQGWLGRWREEDKRKREEAAEADAEAEYVEKWGPIFAKRCAEEEKGVKEAADAILTDAILANSASVKAHVADRQAEEERERKISAEALLQRVFGDAAAEPLRHGEGADKCLVEETPEPQGSLEKFVTAMESLKATMSNMVFAECPMCGRHKARMQNTSRGIECRCGEIYEVPIGPETAVGVEVVEVAEPAWVADPPFPKGFKFVIKRGDMVPSFAKLVDDYFYGPLKGASSGK